MHPRTEISEVVLCTASENVDTHPVLCAVQTLSLRSTDAAIQNDHSLADWDEYNSPLA
jgi:hypothetical protein